MTPAILPLLLVGGMLGDDPAPAEESSARTRLLAGAADSYRFSDDGRDGPEYVRRDEPLLRWTNPLRETDTGALYLWTRDGRPAVGMCVYTYGRNGFDQEMVSLLPTTLVGRTDDGRTWTPQTPGVTFAPVPNAPAPAATAAGRLLQMRGIARRFSGVIVRLDKSEFTLRLIPQPFHRYGDDDGPVRDGALFGYSLGTDPEALLLLEAVPDGDALSWRYALTRMTTAGVRMTLGDDTVYEVERRGTFTILTDPYNTFRGTLPESTEE